MADLRIRIAGARAGFVPRARWVLATFAEWLGRDPVFVDSDAAPARDRSLSSSPASTTGTLTGKPCSPARTAHPRPSSVEGTRSHVTTPATGPATP